MSLNSTLKKKPMSAVATLDLNLSAQHSLQNAKADEKIHAGSGNGPNAVSGAELWAARIGFFAGGFTVEAVKPLTSARGYKADRAPHDKKTGNAGAYTKFQA